MTDNATAQGDHRQLSAFIRRFGPGIVNGLQHAHAKQLTREAVGETEKN